jgi:hypothetical protein
MMNLLDMSKGFGSSTYQIGSSTEQVSGGSIFFRVSVSQGEGSSPDEPGYFFAIDGIGFDFGDVNRLHVEGVSEDEFNVFFF